MKYLINRKTKEHCVCPEGYEYNCIQFAEVQADPEGWIAHTGTECPLPDDVRCGLRFDKINGWSTNKPQLHDWVNVTHYRPILDDRSEPDPNPDNGPEQQCNDLLARLKSAHQAASEIPDLVAELRQALEPLGLGVMYLSQFDRVEP